MNASNNATAQCPNGCGLMRIIDGKWWCASCGDEWGTHEVEAVEVLDLDTTALRVGDIVCTHGMRVLIDTAPITYDHEGASGGTVVSAVGVIINIDDVDADVMAYVRNANYNRPADQPHRWNVQGNHLAHWHIERKVTKGVAR